jgi:hypothetical protein
VSILDLQTVPGVVHKGPPGSPASKASQACNQNVNNASTLSLLCDFP